MLQLELKSQEFYDENTNRFFTIKGRKLSLEHSLVSLSKWESKYKKPWFSKKEKTSEETRYYVKCMTITQNVPDETYYLLTNEDIDKVNAYIEDPMTAAKFKSMHGRRHNGEFVTAETFYYWMVSFNLPEKCEKWHLNRLIALIMMCNEKNKPAKKVGRRQSLNNFIALNEKRLKQFNTKG